VEELLEKYSVAQLLEDIRLMVEIVIEAVQSLMTCVLGERQCADLFL